MANTGDKDLSMLGWYVRNCTVSPMAVQLDGILLRQLDRMQSSLDDDEPDFDDEEDELGRASPRTRRSRLRQLRRLLKGFATAPRSKDNAQRNVRFACEEFDLDRIDKEILLLLVRYGRVRGLEEFADRVVRVLHSSSHAVAALTGMDPHEVHARVGSNGTLVAGGLIAVENDDDSCSGLCGKGGYLKLSPPLRKTIYQSYESRGDWVCAVLGKPLTPTLAWDDFAHLGSDRDLAARVLAGATNRENRGRGINLLLHGPVGTGKTEFCKTLAARASMTVWSVGEADEEGGEPCRGERLASLRIAQRLLCKRAGALILFDEAEDVLEQPSGPFGFRLRERSGSKVHINRLLEQNPLPVLWTCNEVDCIDPAVLRRMTLAIEVKTPNRSVRARIWRRVLADTALDLDQHAVQRLSGRFEAPPAVAANAARAAALAGGGEREIEQAISGVLQLLHIGPRALDSDAGGFDPRIVNCTEDLEGLAERLSRSDGPRNWSLCLYGAPGTGKSLFARHLAGRLGLEVMQKRASDLLSMWVGESEKQIAEAFATARTQNAMLVIDEADSLLSDRRAAVRSWEITQVNEMLTWMENHPLPFVCTTNLVDRLDQASLRRFTFKLRFDSLDPERAARAFKHFFNVELPRPLPEGLTPGDFATVRHKRELFGSASPGVLVEWLEQEVEAKGLRSVVMGFISPRLATGRP
jgi:SpoVK/Ycf46/Vps4 family AAA+-type ATPase